MWDVNARASRQEDFARAEMLGLDIPDPAFLASKSW
jgi:hypothetical protein